MDYEPKTINLNNEINRDYYDTEKLTVTHFSDYTESSNSLRETDKFKIEAINLIIQ